MIGTPQTTQLKNSRTESPKWEWGGTPSLQEKYQFVCWLSEWKVMNISSDCVYDLISMWVQVGVYCGKKLESEAAVDSWRSAPAEVPLLVEFWCLILM